MIPCCLTPQEEEGDWCELKLGLSNVSRSHKYSGLDRTDHALLLAFYSFGTQSRLLVWCLQLGLVLVLQETRHACPSQLIKVSPYITLTLLNNIPGPSAMACRRGILIVSGGKVSCCCCFRLTFFKLAGHTEVTLEGTTKAVVEGTVEADMEATSDAVSAVAVFCRRVQGAMLGWQGNGWDTMSEGGWWKRKTGGRMGSSIR